MEIKTVIEVFTKLIPIYESNLKINFIPLSLQRGLCSSSFIITNKAINSIFDIKVGYYKNYMNNNFYLKGPKIGTKASIKFRLNFMKKEIIELQKLIDNGYDEL